jgi:hypothetical protein
MPAEILQVILDKLLNLFSEFNQVILDLFYKFHSIGRSPFLMVSRTPYPR